MCCIHGARDSTIDTLLEVLCRMTFSVTDVHIAPRLVERGKGKTVGKSTSLKRSISTVMRRYLIAFQGSALFT